MTTTIRAIYEGGVLRPTEPLALPNGETVNVVILQWKPLESHLREPTLVEHEYVRRIPAAKSLQEMFAVMASAPSSTEDEVDISSAFFSRPGSSTH